MKAIRLLKEYQNIDFGCDMSAHIKDCDEAIAELEALESRSCENCKYYRGMYEEDISCNYWGYVNTYLTTPSSMLCKEWEAKQ